MALRSTAALLVAALVLVAGCTQETQNELGRSIQNWTGTNGVLDVFAGEKLVHRFIKVDKLSTALGTKDAQPRAYRYGYGVLDGPRRDFLRRSSLQPSLHCASVIHVTHC